MTDVATMTTHRVVLHLRSLVGGGLRFARLEGPGEEYRMPTSMWEDMGSPAQVTVTVEPGDTLNP